MVTVLITGKAQDQLDQLPRDVVRRLRVLVDRLAAWPAVSGAKPLAGNLAGHFRMRTGDYRLQFSVETLRRTASVTKTVKGKKRVETTVHLDYAVTVERVGHRDTFYER